MIVTVLGNKITLHIYIIIVSTKARTELTTSFASEKPSHYHDYTTWNCLLMILYSVVKFTGNTAFFFFSKHNLNATLARRKMKLLT